jgi:RNA polymerase sigma-32 factor
MASEMVKKIKLNVKKEENTSLQSMEVTSPGKDLQGYINSVHGIGILSKEEEMQLAEDYYYNGNLDSARKLVLAHLRFVVHVAKSYSGYGLSEADLIQEGNIGLMKAVKRFNPEVGVRLVSFAVYWIKAEIHEYVLKNWKIVKIATTKAQRKLFFNLRSKTKKLGWLSEEEIQVISKDLGVTPAEVSEMEKRLSGLDIPFDPSSEDNDDKASYSPSNYLEDKGANPLEIVQDEDMSLINKESLHQALRKLDPRSREIINDRWLSDEKLTLHELADKYKISAERVRQIEQSAMEKVRAIL